MLIQLELEFKLSEIKVLTFVESLLVHTYRDGITDYQMSNIQDPSSSRHRAISPTRRFLRIRLASIELQESRV